MQKISFDHNNFVLTYEDYLGIVIPMSKNFVWKEKEIHESTDSEMGNDFQPALVGALTIIDHSEYTVQTGPNAGKIYKNQKKLFIAKDGTLKTLNKLAAKPDRNGLAGCTFDVSRGPENKKPPAVGDVFDFVMKHKNLASIAEKYGIKVEELGPADYDDEIPFLSPAKLLEMGIGKQPGGIGYEKGYNKAAADL